MQQKLAEEIENRGGMQAVLPEDCQLNLSDFALFMSVMKVKEAYENVLSIILDEPDVRLKEVKAEQVVLNKSGKRAIRLDAWALDMQDRQFDMEMMFLEKIWQCILSANGVRRCRTCLWGTEPERFS